jgi:hypothetical protein
MYWKQPITLSFSKDVLKLLREASALSGISRSSIVETALLFWHEEKFEEWKKVFKP